MSVLHKLKHILCDHLKLQVKMNVMIGGRTTEMIMYVGRKSYNNHPSRGPLFLHWHLDLILMILEVSRNTQSWHFMQF